MATSGANRPNGLLAGTRERVKFLPLGDANRGAASGRCTSAVSDRAAPAGSTPPNRLAPLDSFGAKAGAFAPGWDDPALPRGDSQRPQRARSSRPLAFERAPAARALRRTRGQIELRRSGRPICGLRPSISDSAGFGDTPPVSAENVQITPEPSAAECEAVLRVLAEWLEPPVDETYSSAWRQSGLPGQDDDFPSPAASLRRPGSQA